MALPKIPAGYEALSVLPPVEHRAKTAPWVTILEGGNLLYTLTLGDAIDALSQLGYKVIKQSGAAALYKATAGTLAKLKGNKMTIKTQALLAIASRLSILSANDESGIVCKTLQSLLPKAEVISQGNDGEEMLFKATFVTALTLPEIAKITKTLNAALKPNLSVSCTMDKGSKNSIIMSVEHSKATAALTQKQKQLDVNGDGEIDSTDLKRLRKGEKPEEALVKGNDSYVWLTYTGKGMDVMNEAKRTLHLEPGDRFGVRKSSSGKYIRLVTEREGVNKVFTVEDDVAKKLAKDCKPVK